MATERLYEGAEYCREFTAQVLSCTQKNAGWEVILNRTGFYPEGGGQSADTGTLGTARVLDVQRRGDEIVHFCDRALGGTVHGVIDWARRMDFMRQHGGEHILSGLIHARCGFDNVGFHLGAELVTADFDGELTMEQLLVLEREANRIVEENVPIRCYYPTQEELRTLPYRAKDNLHGAIRFVEIGDVDRCACCGTHVRASGEIGLILIVSAVKFRGGTRVELLCGDRAARYVQAIFAQNRAVSQALSAKPTATYEAVRRLQEEKAAAQRQTAALEARLVALLAAEAAGKERVLLIEPQLSPNAQRALATRIIQAGAACCLVCAADGTGYRYTLASNGADLRETVKRLNACLCGRGGGRPDFAQGSIQAEQAQIQAFWAEI